MRVSLHIQSAFFLSVLGAAERHLQNDVPNDEVAFASAALALVPLAEQMHDRARQEADERSHPPL